MKYCSNCKKRKAPWYGNICQYCQNIPFSSREAIEYEKKHEQKEKDIKNTKQKTDVQINTANIQEKIKLFFAILFSLFILWILFGGLLEKDKTTNIINIDCSQKGSEYNKYCNGDYESEIQKQEFDEDNYYQQSIRH